MPPERESRNFVFTFQLSTVRTEIGSQSLDVTRMIPQVCPGESKDSCRPSTKASAAPVATTTTAMGDERAMECYEACLCYLLRYYICFECTLLMQDGQISFQSCSLFQSNRCCASGLNPSVTVVRAILTWSAPSSALERRTCRRHRRRYRRRRRRMRPPRCRPRAPEGPPIWTPWTRPSLPPPSWPENWRRTGYKMSTTKFCHTGTVFQVI